MVAINSNGYTIDFSRSPRVSKAAMWKFWTACPEYVAAVWLIHIPGSLSFGNMPIFAVVKVLFNLQSYTF